MKHIEKRFLLDYGHNEIDLDNPIFEKYEKEDLANEKFVKNLKGQIAFIGLDNDKVIGGFTHKVDGQNYIFPVPDPTLIYFHNAQTHFRMIKDEKTKLLEKLSLKGELKETAINEIYSYYGITCGFIIFLFTSIESFINQMIPDKFVYENKLKRKTELYNKNQIQESLDFRTKITKVLTEATGKDFFKKATSANQTIWNLKEFRDSIIHTKEDNNPLKYDQLIKKTLNFKYQKCLEDVAKFMNHYKPDYILECKCGRDF